MRLGPSSAKGQQPSARGPRSGKTSLLNIGASVHEAGALQGLGPTAQAMGALCPGIGFETIFKNIVLVHTRLVHLSRRAEAFPEP